MNGLNSNFRSASSLRSPNKPVVPPKPRNIKSSPSPKKSSPEINGVSHVTHSKCNTNGDTPVKMQVKENIYHTDKTENGITIEVPIGVAGDGVYHIVNKIAFLCLPLFILLIHYHQLF